MNHIYRAFFAISLSASLLLSASIPEMKAEELDFIEPQELGRIPILEYHHVGPTEERWTRQVDAFRGDLEWLYNNDYRAISIDDFLAGTFDLPIGKKPVIFTFDDGAPSQLILKEGKVDPLSAVGIMDDFLKSHPDFGSAAVFYVNAKPFVQSDSSKGAIQYLLDSGRQIGNHTIGHGNLSELSADEVERQLKTLEDYIHHTLGFPQLKLSSLAYPFGGVPKGEALEVTKRYVKGALLVGAAPAFAPYHSSFDAYGIHRIQAIEDEWWRHFRRKPGETGVATQPPAFDPYVSDGRRNTVYIRKQSDLKLIRKELLAPGVEVLIGGTPAQVAAAAPSVATKFRYPYEACGDPLAERWIEYKNNGLLSRMATAIAHDWPNRDWSMAHQVVNHWARSQRYAGQRKGVYINSGHLGGKQGNAIVEQLVEVNGNLIVFDIHKQAIRSMTEDSLKRYRDYVTSLRNRGFYVATRIEVASDSFQTAEHPEQAIQWKSGGVWTDNKGHGWLDLSRADTRAYIVRLVKNLIATGVDEVQLDYIRFPTDGLTRQAKYSFDESKLQRWQVIRDLIRDVRQETAKTGTFLSADLLGVVGWNGGYDGWGTGQKIECLAPYLDAMYPMSYPSHFGPGFGGHASPADEPYFFVQQTIKFFDHFAAGTNTDIRSWLQGFKYRVSDYYPGAYVNVQAAAVRDIGADGYVVWNAGNVYDGIFAGMIEPDTIHAAGEEINDTDY
ncbi:MAG: putative glycoside hydrolase [bacterium]|nr:putative glycoside hydrolase [bacterium]